MKRVSVVVLVIMMVTGLGTGLQAAGKRAGRDGQFRRGGLHMYEKNLYSADILLRMADVIGLTDKQKKKIIELNLSNKERFVKQSAEIKIKQIKLGSMLRSEKVDRKKLDLVIREVGRLRTGLQLARVNHLLDIKALLTAEQVSKIKKLRMRRSREMARRMRERRAERAPRPGNNRKQD